MVFLVDLPVRIRGITVMNSDDSFTIFINARLSSEMQLQAYDHEIEHINNKDYDHFYGADKLECIRHGFRIDPAS